MRNEVEKLFVFQFEKLSVFQLVDDFEYSTPRVDVNIILLPQHSTGRLHFIQISKFKFRGGVERLQCNVKESFASFE
jgi:hypothetical protein